MEITEADLQQFIEIYKSEYDVVLTIEQAEREAAKLFELYKLVYLEPDAELHKTINETT